jgi:hypothetical protein
VLDRVVVPRYDAAADGIALNCSVVLPWSGGSVVVKRSGVEWGAKKEYADKSHRDGEIVLEGSVVVKRSEVCEERACRYKPTALGRWSVSPRLQTAPVVDRKEEEESNGEKERERERERKRGHEKKGMETKRKRRKGKKEKEQKKKERRKGKGMQ